MKNTQTIFSLILIQLAVFYVKILNSSAKYWGGANTLWPPNQIIGGAMAPLAPLSRPHDTQYIKTLVRNETVHICLSKIYPGA